MKSNDEIKAELEKLLRERATKIEELKKIEVKLEMYEVITGEKISPVLGEPSNIPEALGGSNGLPPTLAKPPIVPGQFYGLSQTGAAAEYLKMIGHATNITEILDAIRKGGVRVGGNDPKNTLYVGLIRATRKFVKIPPDNFGLLEFYPNRKFNKTQDITGKKKHARKRKHKSLKLSPPEEDSTK